MLQILIDFATWKSEGSCTYCSGQVRGAGDAGREVMAGVGTARLAGQVSAAGPASTSQQLPAPPQISSADLKHLRKAQKREQKAEKKAKKMVALCSCY